VHWESRERTMVSVMKGMGVHAWGRCGDCDCDAVIGVEEKQRIDALTAFRAGAARSNRVVNIMLIL